MITDSDLEVKNEESEENASTEPSGTLCGSRTEDAAGSLDNHCSFKRFDITKDPADHYYIGANGQVLLCFDFDVLIAL